MVKRDHRSFQRNPVITVDQIEIEANIVPTSNTFALLFSHLKTTTPFSNSKRLTGKEKQQKSNKMFMQHITTQTIFPSLMQPSKPRCCRRSPTRHQRHARVKRPTKSLRTPLSPHCRWRECLNVEGMTIKWRGNRVGRKRVFPLKKNDW